MRVPLWGPSPQTCTFALPEPPCYTTPQGHRPRTSGPITGKEQGVYETQQPDQLSSHPGAARPPGHRHAPPPLTLSYQAMEGPSTIRGTPVSRSPPASAPPHKGVLTPGTGQGDDPTPSGPRRPSAPARLPRRFPRNSLSHGDGRSIRPTPSEGSRASGVHTPFGTPPSLGDSLSPETAKSLRSHPSEW